MKKNILKAMAASMLIGGMYGTVNISSLAAVNDDYSIQEQVNQTIHILSDNSLTRGSERPSNSASVHNLSKSSYSYKVNEIGAQVFTNSWLTGKDTMNVSISNWKILQNFGGTNDKVTVYLYNSSNRIVDSEEVTIKNGSGSVEFKGLNSSSKYYICFSVPLNSNKYSFSGTIR